MQGNSANSTQSCYQQKHQQQRQSYQQFQQQRRLQQQQNLLNNMGKNHKNKSNNCYEQTVQQQQQPTYGSSAHGIPNPPRLQQHNQFAVSRYSDDDSSQSSVATPAVAPVFASVHRPRHAGSSSAMKQVNLANSTPCNQQKHQQQRQSYQQFQQQRRLQQQQQNLLKKIKTNNCHEQTLQQQPTYGSSANGIKRKQSIAVSIPNPPQKQQQPQQLHHQQQQQQNHYDVSPTKNASRIPVQQQQQQQMQFQQQQVQFNQISKTATHLLNDIYERHLLNQTTFQDNNEIALQLQHQQQHQQNQHQHQHQRRRQHQQGQQQQHIVLVHNQQHQQSNQKPLHFLKLPPPPPPPPPTTTITTTQSHQHYQPQHQYQHHQQQQQKQQQPPPQQQQQQVKGVKKSTYPYQDHFQFTETYVDPPTSNQHFLLESSLPPPPPAPINHVYETIKERPPLPPPPPERLLKHNLQQLPQNGDTLPPLLPSRQLKKHLPAGGIANSEATTTSLALRKLNGVDYEKGTVAPTPVVCNINKQHYPMKQYNAQKRTKADGEQKSCDYQQLREKKQQQPQQLPPNEHKQLNGMKVSKAQQQQQQQKQQPTYDVKKSATQGNQQREHPLGAANNLDPSAHNSPTTKTTNNGSSCSTSLLPPLFLGLSVEDTLHQAGLLVPTVTSSSSGSNNNNGIHYNQQNNRPSALPIVFEEDNGEFQDVMVLEDDGTAKLPYRHGKIELSVETAQAMAAAAYYARAAQKLAQSSASKSRNSNSEKPNSTTARNGGFCGALQRAPPPMPPGLARRLSNKENYGLGKVKVMLRVADNHNDDGNPHFMAVDKKKRQVTLTDPAAAVHTSSAATSQERGPMVAAPKMFAFDSLFTVDDQQSDVCASSLSEVIPAVLEGSDGCLLTIGYPSSGQAKTMLGGVNPPSELGAIACAISWLYKGINERRQKSGARFSVRVSALGVSATKPDSSAKDLLAAHATESDDSPGVYLRDDFLGGPTELRAPTAERAALFLDAALAGRPHSGLEPAMIFTLHVYQYSLSRKGGVAGGRSRLHLIDLGGCANRNGGLPLSGIGNILLAILSGQRHPPNKDHPLTPLLKDCLAPLTCHVAIMAHVTHTQSHTDALTTIQLASRIHRMRRRKHRFPMPSDKAVAAGALAASAINGGHQSTGSSAGSGADPSSSELSADTVIYMGPSDDATDGEHPPVYLPSLNSADNRGLISKALKGSGLERQASLTKIPAVAKRAPQSPVVGNRTNSLKRIHNCSPLPQNNHPSPHHATNIPNEQQFGSPAHSSKTLPASPKIVAGSLRHTNVMTSKGSNGPTPKGSPMRRPGVGVGANATGDAAECPGSPMRKITEEQWIDGPRVSRAKVAEARHLLREVNHVKQCETWVDGPKSQSSRSLTAGNLPTGSSQLQGYGFMDSHKKSMIRQWVENQTSQVFQSVTSVSAASSPTHIAHRDQQAQHLRNITFHMSQLKQKSLETPPEDLYATSTRVQQRQTTSDQHSLRSSQLELVQPFSNGLTTAVSVTNASAPAEIRGSSNFKQLSSNSNLTSTGQNTTKDETDLHSIHSVHSHAAFGSISLSGMPSYVVPAAADNDEDQDSGPSEVPPALPLIEPLGSREISHESLHRIISRHVSRESLFQQQVQDERLQNSSRQSNHHHYSQQSIGMSDCGLQVTEEEIARTMAGEHPLSALSQCENMSIVSSFHMAGDAFSDCAMGERTRNQFDQLARLRELFTSQLAMAEVTPVFRNGCDVGSVYSEPAYRFNTGPGSVCSEPPYRPPSPARQPSRSPSQGSLPSLNGIMQIAGMEQYASLRHPDGASDPNLPKLEKPFVLEHEDITEVDEKSALLSPSKRPSLEENPATAVLQQLGASLPMGTQSQLPLLPLNTSSEAYDSGHDSSTPRTSKHSGISRRAESGYHSVATARDSDESSLTSGLSKEHHNRITLPPKHKKRQDKGLCNWLMNPFTCTYPETEGEISDF